MATAELANAYAALILADDGVEITVRITIARKMVEQMTDMPQAEKLTTLIKAAKVEEVEPIWSTLFAKVRLPTWSPRIRTKRTKE
jgi:large subunit ribosomal protein LP1